MILSTRTVVRPLLFRSFPSGVPVCQAAREDNKGGVSLRRCALPHDALILGVTTQLPRGSTLSPNAFTNGTSSPALSGQFVVQDSTVRVPLLPDWVHWARMSDVVR